MIIKLFIFTFILSFALVKSECYENLSQCYQDVFNQNACPGSTVLLFPSLSLLNRPRKDVQTLQQTITSVALFDVLNVCPASMTMVVVMKLKNSFTCQYFHAEHIVKLILHPILDTHTLVLINLCMKVHLQFLPML